MKAAKVLLWVTSLLSPVYGAQSTFDPSNNTWALTNGWIRAVFQLDSAGHFLSQEVSDLHSGDRWLPSANQPSAVIRFQTSAETFDAQEQYVLIGQSVGAISPSGISQSIVVGNLSGTAQFTLKLELYDNRPVLHYSLAYRNLTGSTVYVSSVNMLPWTFDDSGKRYTAFRVNQWSVSGMPEDFESYQAVLDLAGTPFEVFAGAHADHCSWLALHDTDNRGIFTGWEFDGRSKASARQVGSGKYLDFSSSVLDLHHPVDPSTDFIIPGAFIGLFHGDFDEAGYETQRFVEAVLAKPAPDGNTFPYVSWDSWAYQDQIDEQTLRDNATVAAALGVELFVVDLGWAQSIGNWYADPNKFPSGMGALSDFVHSLGLKFGLHFALTQADPASPVLQQNPDWTSSEEDNYFGSASLCLSHQPVRDWLVQQAIRMIDDYHVDWILQDGENMVKTCTKTTHTHDPADSNYANSVQGLNAVVSAIQQARPQVLWENCENGGNMMTFNMVRTYVTSITNDASGSLQSRRAAYGATYPFPPRFAERYMPSSDGLDPYATHSYRFGGPWVLMSKLTDLTPDQKGFLAREISSYKDQRDAISRGKVFHILPPANSATDAIQSYDPTTDSAIAVVTRAASDGPLYQFRPRGLDPSQRYTVWFEIDPSVHSMSGAQLMSQGVGVHLPVPFSSDVVHIEHQ